MAKKRRDKERDSSTVSKVAKVGAAALAIGGGAAVFNNTSLKRTLSSEFIPSAKTAIKKTNKELRDLKATRTGLDKRTTGKDLRDAFRLGKKTFEEERKLRKDSFKFNSARKNNLFGQIKNIDQVRASDAIRGIKANYETELKKQEVFKLIAKYTKKENIERNPVTIKNTALEAYEKINENAVVSKDNKIAFSNFLDKYFNKMNFSNEEKQEFLEYIYNSKKDMSEKVRNNFSKTRKIREQVDKELRNSLLDNKKTSDTIFGKVDKFAKNVLGLEIDSELLFSGDKAMTLGDFKKFTESKDYNPRMFDYVTKDENGRLVKKNLKDFIDKMPELDDNIIFDKAIRINRNGEIYSTAEVRDIADKAIDDFSVSTLGRIFGLTDAIKLKKSNPIFVNFKALNTSLLGAYEEGNTSTTAFTSKIAIGNSSTGKAKLFETVLDEQGNLVLSDKIADGIINNNMHGKGARLTKEFLGTNKDILTASDNELAKKLDIDQTGSYTMFNKIKDIFTGKSKRDQDTVKDKLLRVKRFVGSDLSTEEKIDQLSYVYAEAKGMDFSEENLLEASANIANMVLEDNKKLSSILNDITASQQVTDSSISSLIHSGAITDKESLRILNILNNKEYENAEELLYLINNSGESNFFNQDLNNIFNKGLSNIDHLMNMQNISQVDSKSIFGYSVSSTNVLDAENIIRREALKEVMLRESNGGVKSGIVNLEKVLQNSNLTLEQQKNLRYLANWSIMQKNLEIYNDFDQDLHLNQLIGEGSPLKKLDDLLTTSPTFKQEYMNMIDDLGSRTNIYDKTFGSLNETYINEYDNYTFNRESALSRLGQIKSINDAIKLAGQAGKELTANRNGDLSNYTSLTQIPQFMVARLMWGLEGVGLNLSSENTGSTLELIKNIGLKRVLPAMAAYKLYDYLNFESENFTGVSITGAAANAVSNVDIAARKLAYATGIGQAINWAKESSIIGEYWTGTNEFQDADERKEWYENGVSVVRRGRFWGFGSANEFRGGSVQYYQPNYLRRAHSNYKDISIYGSENEKWKHSWIPTIRHPLSPIRAFLDPYWLEKKHMDDRPYPLTGKLFTEGTPWGAILNPTLGEMIKPVRMLPEVKKRLGSDGRDIRTVLKHINEKIKARGNKNDDVLIFEGTDVRNAKYVPYGNPGDGHMNINISHGEVSSPGVGFVENNVESFNHLNVPNGDVNPAFDKTQAIDPNSPIVQTISSQSQETGAIARQIVSGLNKYIKKAANYLTGYESNPAYNKGVLPDKTKGTYVYTNLVNQMNIRNSNYYSDIEDPSLVNKSLVTNFMQDGIYSMKQLSGIYGFLGDFAFGEDSYKMRYADAGAMTSFSRGFWDSQVGGIGGELMEIARRFFPSEDKSIIRYNPLRNNMPEWLPERFLTGDPFTSLPKGEMRLPGKGYETLNNLHPDTFGEYGAFDRFKILADIAPSSQEYKIWRNIARNTVTDPELIKEMKEIQQRANKMSGNHEFFNYRYIRNNVKMKKGVVKSINGSIVELASGEKLNLGGIVLDKDADVHDVLDVGQHINYRTSANAIKRLEDGLITNAVIYDTDGLGTNINKTLIERGMATKDKEDTSAIGYLANASAMQETLGAIQEVIGHANIPFLHNKYLKIETARESFMNEQVYGNSLTTWDHPIEGFVKPAFNRISGQSMLQHAGAVASAALFMNIGKLTSESYLKYGAGALMAATNPTALLGMGTAALWNLGVRTTNIGKKTNIEVGAGVGAVLGSLAWGWNNAENPLKATTSFAFAGETLSRYLKLDELGLGHGKGAAIGALVGLGVSAIKNPDFDKDMFRRKWIPKKVEKKFELDEYFDRLEYVKYKGLYNQAALRAFVFEGSVNIKKAFRKIDKNKEKVAKLIKKAEKLSNKYTAGGYEYDQQMMKINNKIQALQSQQTMLKGGKYTKAAVAYKKAMESTIYGLSEGATQDEILASIPDQYKDYFINFMNETDKNERKKILKSLPEYLRKPLQIAWREKVKKVDSNRKFFKKHKLPGMNWRGWKPNVNLKHVKMKTIQNEGMLLSDFGYYESEKGKAQYQDAPDIHKFDKGTGGIKYASNMVTAMSGLGVSLQNISMSPTSAPGLWIVGDISQTASDVKKIGEYGVQSGIQGLVSMLF